ncbi:MAG: hypothetical protein FE78DRAFT_34936 [Acidomyces sp. 'richmondensis']|nr:MAG: hypothetical protein FE78DRAFT_34936 [Acidomyces sp. 'richmondensis']
MLKIQYESLESRVPNHIWDYSDDTYLHNLENLRIIQIKGNIDHIGLMNVDAAHIELLLDPGFKAATNQLSCSVIDRRLIRGRHGKTCIDGCVGVLAYWTILGRFIGEKRLGKSEPRDLTNLN